MTAIQQYQHFIKEVEAQVNKTQNEAFNIFKENILTKEYDENKKERMEQILREYEFQIQIYKAKALDNFKDNLKKTVEMHYQSFAHNQTMRIQRFKSRLQRNDEIQDEIKQQILDKQQNNRKQQDEYLTSFEEEFNANNKQYFDNLKEIEQRIENIQL